MRLYPYQKRVAQLIRQGKSVVLQAPTGTGKNLAALWPFLEAWDRNQPESFPRKCIYSVPMRVLANQFVQEINQMVTERMLFAEPPKVTIQTGEQPQDPKLQGNIIFATIDQSLSSALAVPYSLSTGWRISMPALSMLAILSLMSFISSHWLMKTGQKAH